MEKVFVHTDKSFYFVGETVWLKAYLADASFDELSNLSKIVQIELIDSKGRPWYQERVQLSEGTGKGQFYIEQQLPSGIYYLKAYTTWMRNFDEELFFRKRILIINPFVTLPDIDDSTMDLSVSFFPEGGSLTAGIENKIVYEISGKARDQYHIIIENNQKEKVAEILTNNIIGSLMLVPEVDRKYYPLDVTRVDSVKVGDLPDIKSRSLTLSVLSEQPHETLEVRVRSVNLADQIVFILVQNDGQIQYTSMQRLENGVTNFFIPTNDFKTGVSHITVFNEDFEHVSERLIFIPPGEVQILSVATNKKAYGNREMVRLSLKSSEAVNLSVSVHRYEPGLDVAQNDIRANFLLGSDISSSTHDSSLFLNRDTIVPALKDLLIARKWKGFSWSDVLSQNSFESRYLMDYVSPIVGGTVRGNGYAGKNLFIAFPGRNPEFFTTTLDSNGNFMVEVPPYIDSGDILFTSDEFELSGVALMPYFDALAAPSPMPYEIDRSLETFIETYSAHVQIANAYENQTRIRGIPKTRKVRTPFYGSAEHHYLLDDYTRFKRMDEVFIEYVRNVRRRKNDGAYMFYTLDYYANLFSNASNLFFDQPAMTMIDGVPVDGPNTVFDFDPLKVERIDIVTRKIRTGSIDHYGLVNFSTYNGDFGGVALPDNIIRKSYQGIQRPVDFYSPTYEDEKNSTSTIPDYRKVLLWEPDISIEPGNLELVFFTSDDAGTYKIEVNGVSSSGKVIYEHSLFEVVESEMDNTITR